MPFNTDYYREFVDLSHLWLLWKGLTYSNRAVASEHLELWNALVGHSRFRQLLEHPPMHWVGAIGRSDTRVVLVGLEPGTTGRITQRERALGLFRVLHRVSADSCAFFRRVFTGDGAVALGGNIYWRNSCVVAHYAIEGREPPPAAKDRIAWLDRHLVNVDLRPLRARTHAAMLGIEAVHALLSVPARRQRLAAFIDALHPRVILTYGEDAQQCFGGGLTPVPCQTSKGKLFRLRNPAVQLSAPVFACTHASRVMSNDEWCAIGRAIAKELGAD